MNISSHINTLVKFHECVVVPEFGGFISNYKPAKYDQIKNTFTPPSKDVVFNVMINKNDGLLINHLVESEGLSYSEAHQFVSNFVDQLWKQLNNRETVVMDQLGTFFLDKNGSIVFNPENSFELIETYGLSTFSFAPLHTDQTISTYQPRPAIKLIQYKQNRYKIAASFALIMALSFFPVKNNNEHILTSNLDPVSIVAESNNVLIENQVESKPMEEVVITEVKKEAPYLLVGGNFQHLENANLLSEQLIQLGHQPEIIKLNNGNYRVAIDSYYDYDEALKAMENYRLQNPGSDVWVGKR